MKKILFLSLVLCLIFAFTSNAFATEVIVTTPEQLAEAFTDYSKNTIKLGADISISNGNTSEASWSRSELEISGDNRTLDFNGHRLTIESNEYIQVNYRTNHNLTITDNSVGEPGGIYAEYSNRYNTVSPFKFYNFTSSNVELIVNGGNFVTSTDCIFRDSLYNFRIIINGGNFESSESLFEFGYSYNTDVLLSNFTFSLWDGSYNSSINLVSSRLSYEYTFTKLAEGKYCFLVDDEEIWTDISTEMLGESYPSDFKIVVCSEEEAPSGALLPEIPNIKMENGEISWSKFSDENLAKFKYFCYYFESSLDDPEATSLDMNQVFTERKEESKTYVIRFYAADSNSNPITRYYGFMFDYVSPLPRLAAPTNVKWTGTMTASWDPVPNATSYNIAIKISKTASTVSFYQNTSNTSYDFSSDYRFSSNTNWYFYVTASADNYLDSDSTYCEDGKDGWFVVGDLSNVTLSDDGILSWDPYEGATEYQFMLATGGGSNNDSTSINLKKEATSYGCTPGQTYNWYVKAVREVNGISYDLTNFASGTYTYTIKPSLQNVVLSGDIITWDAFEGATYYTIYFGIYADEVRDGLSFNLKEYADEHNFADGEYDFKIKA